METAKLGPLAFYKVPGWGCVGWAGRVERGEAGWEQSLRSRTVVGQEPSRLCCRQPDCFLRQASVPGSALERREPWPLPGLQPGPGTAAAALLHPSGSQTGTQVRAAVLQHALDVTDHGPYVPGLGAVTCVFSLAPGRAPEEGFQTRGFFQMLPVRHFPCYSLSAHLPQAASNPLLNRGCGI